MEDVEVIDATVPDHSGDERFWASVFFDEVWNTDRPIGQDEIEGWFRRALATGARQALIDVSLIEPCTQCEAICCGSEFHMRPRLTINGATYRLECDICHEDMFVEATSIEELRIAWNARMQ